MKKIILPLLLGLLSILPFSARAEWFEPWTRTDTVYQLAFTGVTVIDLWQTAYIGSPGQCPSIRHETNGFGLLGSKVLGMCPTWSRILPTGAAAVAGHAAVAYLLPQPYRRIWQMTWIGVEAGTVSWNFSVGVQLTF